VIIQPEAEYTWQDLGPHFQVHPKTVYRWFRRFKHKKFHPTQNTSRLKGEVVLAFIERRTVIVRPAKKT
jgi:hypothetical protein